MIINQKFKGVFTSRDQSCIQYDNEIIDSPINTAIVRWDLRYNKIIFYQNLTQSIITVLIPLYKNNFQYLMLCSYQGEINIIKSDCLTNKYKKLDIVSNSFNLNKSKLTFGTVSDQGDYLIACCEKSLNDFGSINILKVDQLDRTFKISIFKVVQQNFYFAHFLNTSPLRVWVLDQPNTNTSQKTTMKIIEFQTEDSQYTVINQNKIEHLNSYVYHISFNNSFSQYSNNYIVMYTFQSDIFIIDCKNNTLLYYIEKPMIKKCFIKYIIFRNNNSLLVGADSGRLIQWQKQNKQYVKTNEYVCPSEPIYYMDFYQKDYSKILMNTISQFSKFQLVEKKSDFNLDFEFELNTLTNSACAVSDCGLFSSSADFSGNIFIWNNQSEDNNKYLYKCSLQMMIRSILLLKTTYEQYEILVGNLEGQVYQIKLNYDKKKNYFVETGRQVVVQLKGGIICMDYSHKKVFKHFQKEKIQEQKCDSYIYYVAEDYLERLYNNITIEEIENYQNYEIQKFKKIVIGTSEGYLCLMEQTIYGYVLLLVNQAHKPVKEYFDERFGSLSKYAEIWSICFSPENQYIATCSEDQTAKIWDFHGNLIQTFVGHSTAVTSTDWQFCEFNNKEIFITCGDDQKAIIWTLNEANRNYKRKWILNKLFETQNKGLDWHTLTYLKLFPYKNGKIYAILTTENGKSSFWINRRTRYLMEIRQNMVLYSVKRLHSWYF